MITINGVTLDDSSPSRKFKQLISKLFYEDYLSEMRFEDKSVKLILSSTWTYLYVHINSVLRKHRIDNCFYVKKQRDMSCVVTIKDEYFSSECLDRMLALCELIDGI